MPVYLAAILIWIVPFLAVLFVLMNMVRHANPNPLAVIAFFIVALAMLFVAVRLIVALAVGSAESVSPFGILQRSWTITAGNWWRLFAFLALFLVAAFCVMIATGAVIGTLVGLIIGPPHRLDLSALLITLLVQLAVSVVTAVFIVMLARIYAQLTGRADAQASVPSSGT